MCFECRFGCRLRENKGTTYDSLSFLLSLMTPAAAAGVYCELASGHPGRQSQTFCLSRVIVQGFRDIAKDISIISFPFFECYGRRVSRWSTTSYVSASFGWRRDADAMATVGEEQMELIALGCSNQSGQSLSSIRAEVAHRKRTEEEGEIVWGGGANHILPLPPCSQSHSTHRPHLKNATFNSFPVKLNLGLPSDRSDSTSRLRNSKWQAKEKTTTKRLLKTEWPAAP